MASSRLSPLRTSVSVAWWRSPWSAVLDCRAGSSGNRFAERTRAQPCYTSASGSHAGTSVMIGFCNLSWYGTPTSNCFLDVQHTPACYSACADATTSKSYRIRSRSPAPNDVCCPTYASIPPNSLSITFRASYKDSGLPGIPY